MLKIIKKILIVLYYIYNIKNRTIIFVISKVKKYELMNL